MAETKIWDAVPGFDWNEEIDFKDAPSWFLDASHSWPPATPMSSWFWLKGVGIQGEVLTNQLSTPTSKGSPKRGIWGGFYSGPLIVRDEQEIKQRRVKHREAMQPFIEDFEGWWRKSKDELMSMYSRYKHFNLDEATNNELLNHLYDLIAMGRRMWFIHFLGMQPVFNGWVMFEDLCKELWGLTDTNPEFLKLMVGFDNKIFQVDKRLWQLSKDAINKGLSGIFMTTEAGEVIAKLWQIEKGKEWLKGLDEFLDEDGWRMQRMAGFDEPTWIEDPTPAIMMIKGFIAKGGDFELDKIRERLAREREEAVAAIVQRVPEERRDEFLKLLRLAQQAGIYSEEHTYYCEMLGHAITRRSLLGIGRRLAQEGTVDRPDDILFLNPDEVERVVTAPECHDLRYIVNRRRKEWEEWHTMDRPMVLTSRRSIEEAFEEDRKGLREPILPKVSGGELPMVTPELEADLYGICGAPGVAEGPARVIINPEQLGAIKPGDILVAPNTATSWSPLFSLIKGVVVNRCGTLGHASVVAREHAIPAVVNTVNASGQLEAVSGRIKNGQKIRVDGTQGAVYILE